MARLPQALFIVLLLLLSSGSSPAQPAESLSIVLRQPAGVFVSQGEAGLEGYDIDLLERYLAWYRSTNGQEIRTRRTVVGSVGDLLERVQQGECDLAIGSITATAERDEIVDFSLHYLPVRMVAFGVAGRVEAGPVQESLAGQRVGGLVSSTGAQRVQELALEVPDLEPRTEYASYESMFEALLAPTPEIDAVVTDVTHFWVLDKTQDLVLIAPVGPQQGLAFVLPQGSTLKASLDAFLEEFFGSASYYQLVRDYFGEGASEMIRLAR